LTTAVDGASGSFQKVLGCVTPAGKVNNILVASFLLEMAERSEAKSAKRRFA